MANELVSAKQKKAEKLEGKFQSKRNRLAVKVSKAGNPTKAQVKLGKIKAAEQKTYDKIKNLEQKQGYELSGRPKQFITDFEKEKQYKLQESQGIKPIDAYQNKIEMRVTPINKKIKLR